MRYNYVFIIVFIIVLYYKKITLHWQMSLWNSTKCDNSAVLEIWNFLQYVRKSKAKEGTKTKIEKRNIKRDPLNYKILIYIVNCRI